MPKFINKSWPILLMPIWWILWILGFIFHNAYLRFRNEYRKVKPRNRKDPKVEDAKKSGQDPDKKKMHRKKKKEKSVSSPTSDLKNNNQEGKEEINQEKEKK